MSKAKKQLSHLEWLHKKQENSAGSKQTKLKRSNTENVDDIPNEQNISPSRFMNRHNNKLNEKAQSLSKLESKIKQEQQKVKQGREISNKTSNDWRHGPKSMKGIHLKEVIKFKNTGINRSKQGVQITKLQSQVNLGKKQSQTFSDLEQNVQRFQRNSKLLEKIPDHRRIRSSSKISEKILEIKHFFKDEHNDESQKSQNKSNQDEDQRSEEHNKQRQQKLEELQHLLQLKLKTEPDQSTPFDLKSFRQTGFSKVTQMSTTSRYSIGLNIQKSKLSDILSKKQLNNSKSLIKQNEEQRQSKNLSPHPKQWQFHNCLSLQKIQLYRTNLRISCEGWTAIDYLELKYLRGWNPKVEDDFSPIIRLFIAKVCLGLGDYYGFKYDVDRIFVRVNDKHIYFDQREKLQEKGEKIKGIAPHTILSLRQLITATTLTTHQDLVTHSVLALGYIIKKFHNSKYPSPRTHPTQSSQNRIDPLAQIRSQDGYLVFIKQTQASVLQDYCENFQQQCARLCRSLQMSNTRVMVGFNCLYRNFWGRTHKNKMSKGLYQVNQYMVVSSSLDAAILFMKCMADHTFKKMFQFRVYEAEVKFQVGWNFWETRTLRWPNSEYLKYRLKGVGGKTNKGNQCYVVWDEQRNLIISMADCKVNMHWKDTERIQEWVEKHIPRFSKNYCLNMTFYPSDTQKFMKIN